MRPFIIYRGISIQAKLRFEGISLEYIFFLRSLHRHEFPTMVGNSQRKAKNDFSSKNQFMWSGIPNQKFPTVVENSRPRLSRIPDRGREFPAKSKKYFFGAPLLRGREFPTVVENSRRPRGIPDRGREFPATVVGNSRPWSGIPDQKQKMISVQKINFCGWEFPTVVGNS